MNYPKPQAPDTELSNCTTMSAKKNESLRTSVVCVWADGCVLVHKCVCVCALKTQDAGLDLSHGLQRSDYSPTGIDRAVFYSYLICLEAVG